MSFDSGLLKNIIQSALVVLTLGSAISACDRSGQGDASLQTIYDRNWISWAGQTIGPVQNSAGMRTLIDCPTYAKYDEAMKATWNKRNADIESIVHDSVGCGFILSNSRGVQYFGTLGIEAFAQSCGSSLSTRASSHVGEATARGRDIVKNSFSTVDFGYTPGIEDRAANLQTCWSDFDQISR